ncbi:hypothetical protein CRP01_08065 [Flavilitoribacter nigricans DSM 23189 = NBRC 102662]|uniref:Uncharacterized protein n=1 Tax=Flavilitoribacter nigricans (strain ATCC 23147 / DSM 23189 / NBRC 102662 / NCIMB 1420 / SS-2) TaxID=1122177 RepID=A0A2D0NF86_FLAN2|nr:hypothetical protein CRP01_08065 [Flavilitoribacter nigricans DSM 23189 = NBRC 102662]
MLLTATLFLLTAKAQEEAVLVVNEIYCLGTRACTPHTSVAFELPPNTTRWFYTLSTTQKLKKAKRIRKNPQLLAMVSAPGVEREKMDEYEEPVFGGDANCSVYLLKHYTDQENFGKPGGVYFYYPEYSQKETPSLGMVIDESVICHGKQYIGLENPNAYTDLVNIYAVLTVVAITQKKEKQNDQ